MAGPTSTLPVVGITTYVEPASWGVWTAPAALLPASYLRAVERSGAQPVLLPPPDDGNGDVARRALEATSRLDALVLAGGPDVDPARYGAAPHPRTAPSRPERDAWELALAAAALDQERPVLAVCRGMQLLNVALGGTLVQHLPDVVGHDGHAPGPGERGEHAVSIDGDSALGAVLGTRTTVPTYHHQGLDRLADGVEPVAWADDGTVEAVALAGHPQVMAVQWHPEEGADPRLFDWLAAAAAQAGQAS